MVGLPRAHSRNWQIPRLFDALVAAVLHLFAHARSESEVREMAEQLAQSMKARSCWRDSTDAAAAAYWAGEWRVSCELRHLPGLSSF